MLHQVWSKLLGHDTIVITHPNDLKTAKPTVDAPFTKNKLDQDLGKLSRYAAPGHDHITYCLLRKPNEEHQESLSGVLQPARTGLKE